MMAQVSYMFSALHRYPGRNKARYKKYNQSLFLKVKTTEFGTQALFLGIHDALLREALPRVKGAQPAAP